MKREYLKPTIKHIEEITWENRDEMSLSSDRLLLSSSFPHHFPLTTKLSALDVSFHPYIPCLRLEICSKRKTLPPLILSFPFIFSYFFQHINYEKEKLGMVL